MSLPSDIEARVGALRREGRYAQAAELCREHGEHGRASELHAAVWDWATAIGVAEEAGLLALAYDHALAGEDRSAARRLLRALMRDPEQAVEGARHAERRGQLVDAARLYEAAAEVDLAADLYSRAGELFEAARCREAQGRYREAGLLYERRVRESPDDGEAALRLGRILAHFGRWEHAVRALQKAAEDPVRRQAAVRLMVACFAALGLDDAAASHLDELRLADPSIPVTVPEFLEERFGDAKGMAGLLGEGRKDEGRKDDGARLLAGRYRVLQPLGAGATGRVLLAYDGFYDRQVAVKVLTVGAGSAGRDAYARFAREARVAAGLDHPNVVQVFEFNPDGPFLVMEFMAGGTLEDRMGEDAGRALPLEVVRHVVLSVLEGLEAVHRRGVVHRDLKPANVFFGTTGNVKIGDFGVAHLADLGATLTGAMLGTLAYMSPEQITGARLPDASTDLYALGVMWFRMLTGTLPFPGPDFVTQHLQQPVPRLAQVEPALARFDEVIGWCLAKRAEDRPHGAGEVRERIESIDWTEPEGAAGIDVQPSSPPDKPRTDPPPSAPPPDHRYVQIEELAHGVSLCRDELLGRLVRIEPVDEARAARLRVLAAADSPFLQAVYLVDGDEGHAILEQPTGRLLSETELSASRRAEVRAQVGAALERIHGAGGVHGAVRPDRVRVAEGRAVLLLPPPNTPLAAEGDDLAALESL